MRWARLAVVNTLAGGVRRQRNEIGDVSQYAVISLPLHTELESVQNTNAAKTKDGKEKKRKERYSPCPPPLFLVAGSPLGTNFVRPLSSQIYIVGTTKRAGTSLQNTTLVPMLFKRFNSFKSFKCFKGAINPHHTCVCGFKGNCLWDER